MIEASSNAAIERAMLPVQLQVAQEWLSANWKGMLTVWFLTTVVFWFMGGFTPAIAGPPLRMRRQLTVRAQPFQPQWLQ